MNNSYVKTAADYQYHNENMIISMIVKALTSMLESIGAGDEWQVARSNQPTIQAMQNNTVYFDIISKRRLGVQAEKPVQINQEWRTASCWFEDWLVQISAFKQRTPEDGPETITSVDIITKLQACINGGGAAPTVGAYRGGTTPTWWGVDWINIIRSTDLREIDFETDSGLKEKMPQFDFSLVISQSILSDTPAVSDIEIETQPV